MLWQNMHSQEHQDQGQSKQHFALEQHKGFGCNGVTWDQPSHVDVEVGGWMELLGSGKRSDAKSARVGSDARCSLSGTGSLLSLLPDA